MPALAQPAQDTTPETTAIPILDFRAIFEAVPGAYLILTPDFIIVAVSDAYLQATNTVRETIVGRPLFEVFPDNPNDPQATGVKNLTASLQSVLKHKAPHSMAVQKYDIKRPKSQGGGFEVRYWSPLNAPVLDKNGDVALIVHSVVDVTKFMELKETEAQQNRLAEQLKEQSRLFQAQVVQGMHEIEARKKTEEEVLRLNKIKSEFIALASHQLRTPLTATKWYTEALLTPPANMTETKKKHYLEQIRTSTERMIELVSTLLDVSKIDVGTLSGKPELIDLPSILDEVIKDFATAAHDKEITLATHIDKNLVPTMADPHWIHLTFYNLISNAIKYSQAGQPVTISLEQLPGDILIKVEDKGCGIPPTQHDKIFTKLFRAENAQRIAPEGSGLGLYITKAVVERAGGSIWFESVENVGTTFYVKIPVVSH